MDPFTPFEMQDRGLCDVVTGAWRFGGFRGGVERRPQHHGGSLGLGRRGIAGFWGVSWAQDGFRGLDLEGSGFWGPGFRGLGSRDSV